MFRRLRYKIALQFTALVFALMLVVGGVYIGVQYFSTHRSTSDQLRNDAALIQMELVEAGPADSADLLTIAGSADGASVRVYTVQGDVLFAGDLFGRISAPMQPDAVARFLTVKGSTGYYRVYQVPVVTQGGSDAVRPDRATGAYRYA